MPHDIAIDRSALAGEDRHSRVVRILERYPYISSRESGEVLRYVRRARTLDLARLRADHSIERQLDQFMVSHQPALRLTSTEVITMAALLIAFLASCWLLAVSS